MAFIKLFVTISQHLSQQWLTNEIITLEVLEIASQVNDATE
jgi:hypothetical protein